MGRSASRSAWTFRRGRGRRRASSNVLMASSSSIEAGSAVRSVNPSPVASALSSSAAMRSTRRSKCSRMRGFARAPAATRAGPRAPVELGLRAWPGGRASARGGPLRNAVGGVEAPRRDRRRAAPGRLPVRQRRRAFGVDVRDLRPRRTNRQHCHSKAATTTRTNRSVFVHGP